MAIDPGGTFARLTTRDTGWYGGISDHEAVKTSARARNPIHQPLTTYLRPHLVVSYPGFLAVEICHFVNGSP